MASRWALCSVCPYPNLRMALRGIGTALTSTSSILFALVVSVTIHQATDPLASFASLTPGCQKSCITASMSFQVLVALGPHSPSWPFHLARPPGFLQINMWHRTMTSLLSLYGSTASPSLSSHVSIFGILGTRPSRLTRASNANNVFRALLCCSRRHGRWVSVASGALLVVLSLSLLLCVAV